MRPLVLQGGHLQGCDISRKSERSPLLSLNLSMGLPGMPVSDLRLQPYSHRWLFHGHSVPRPPPPGTSLWLQGPHDAQCICGSLSGLSRLHIWLHSQGTMM